MSLPARASRAAWITARDLVGGLLLGIACGAALDKLGKPWPLVLRRGVSGLAAAGLIGAAGALWGRDMAQLAGAADPRGAARATGLAIGPSVVLVALVLTAVEPGLVARGAGAGVAIHVIYTLLFVPAVLIVAAIGGFALGAGLRAPGLAVRLSLGAGVAAGSAFLALDLLMDTLGWRVGGPHAGERATMLVVTALGAMAAALAAGGTVGHLLLRRPWPRPSSKAAA